MVICGNYSCALGPLWGGYGDGGVEHTLDVRSEAQGAAGEVGPDFSLRDSFAAGAGGHARSNGLLSGSTVKEPDRVAAPARGAHAGGGFYGAPGRGGGRRQCGAGAVLGGAVDGCLERGGGQVVVGVF